MWPSVQTNMHSIKRFFREDSGGHTERREYTSDSEIDSTDGQCSENRNKKEQQSDAAKFGTTLCWSDSEEKETKQYRIVSADTEEDEFSCSDEDDDNTQRQTTYFGDDVFTFHKVDELGKNASDPESEGSRQFFRSDGDNIRLEKRTRGSNFLSNNVNYNNDIDFYDNGYEQNVSFIYYKNYVIF